MLIAFAAIAGLALGGAYPVAIVLAAVAVPSLVVLYLVDVDIYENEPLARDRADGWRGER